MERFQALMCLGLIVMAGTLLCCLPCPKRRSRGGLVSGPAKSSPLSVRRGRRSRVLGSLLQRLATAPRFRWPQE